MKVLQTLVGWLVPAIEHGRTIRPCPEPRRRVVMAEYERSATVHATPAATYEYLADPRHMPEYVATMTQAQRSDRAHLHVTAEVEGRHEEGDAMFRSDPSSRRLEWNREGHAYRGWLTVAGDNGSTSRSRSTSRRTTSWTAPPSSWRLTQRLPTSSTRSRIGSDWRSISRGDRSTGRADCRRRALDARLARRLGGPGHRGDRGAVRT